MSSQTKSVILTVFVSLVLDLIAFTMILPLLPSLLDYYSDREDGLYRSVYDGMVRFRAAMGIPDTARWNSVLLGGIIGSMFSLLQYVSSPLIGALSDVYGRKPVLLMSLTASLSSYVLFAVSSTFPLFVMSRVLGGLSKGNTGLCIAILTDVTDTHSRGKAMALVGIAYSLGFLIGPLMGAGFARLIRLHPEMFFQAPALVGVVMTALEMFLILACLRETLPASKRMLSLGSSLSDMLAYINPVSLFTFRKVQLSEKGSRLLRSVGVVYFLFLFLFSGVEFTLTFLVHERFNYDSMQQGKMFFFMGCVMAVIQGGFVRRLRPGMEVRIAQSGVALLMLSFIITGLATNTVIFYTGLLLFSYGSATVVPCLTTLASNQGSEEQKGTVLGIFRSLGAFARAFGPVAACTVYWILGPINCYLLSMVSLLLPLGLLQVTKRLQPPTISGGADVLKGQ